MTRTALGALLALALLAPEARAASPRSDALELKLGSYRPEIDSEAGLTGTPYATTFGDKSILLFEAEYEHQLFQTFGTFALGGSVGYGEIYGHGKYATGPLAGQSSGDVTALKVYPLKVLAVYRFDWLSQRFDIPLVPFGKAGLIYQLYRVTNGAGDVATDSEGKKGEGGRAGWEVDAGLALQLDFFDEPLARDFDLDVGVNHSYLFAEWRHAQIDGFGTSGLVFSDNLWTFGLALEF